VPCVGGDAGGAAGFFVMSVCKSCSTLVDINNTEGHHASCASRAPQINDTVAMAARALANITGVQLANTGSQLAVNTWTQIAENAEAYANRRLARNQRQRARRRERNRLANTAGQAYKQQPQIFRRISNANQSKPGNCSRCGTAFSSKTKFYRHTCSSEAPVGHQIRPHGRGVFTGRLFIPRWEQPVENDEYHASGW
jgi:uncharacterized protein YhbP (UPF0306 family)